MVILLICLIFVIVYIAGMISGCWFLIKMINSDSIKDRQWANDIIKKGVKKS